MCKKYTYMENKVSNNNIFTFTPQVHFIVFQLQIGTKFRSNFYLNIVSVFHYRNICSRVTPTFDSMTEQAPLALI